MKKVSLDHGERLRAAAGPVEPPVRPCLTVYGDGVNDDAEALQAYLDGKADLIHADGTPYALPGATGRMYHIGHTLYVGRTTDPRVAHLDSQQMRDGLAVLDDLHRVYTRRAIASESGPARRRADHAHHAQRVITDQHLDDALPGQCAAVDHGADPGRLRANRRRDQHQGQQTQQRGAHHLAFPFSAIYLASAAAFALKRPTTACAKSPMCGAAK